MARMMRLDVCFLPEKLANQYGSAVRRNQIVSRFSLKLFGEFQFSFPKLRLIQVFFTSELEPGSIQHHNVDGSHEIIRLGIVPVVTDNAPSAFIRQLAEVLRKLAFEKGLSTEAIDEAEKQLLACGEDLKIWRPRLSKRTTFIELKSYFVIKSSRWENFANLYLQVTDVSSGRTVDRLFMQANIPEILSVCSDYIVTADLIVGKPKLDLQCNFYRYRGFKIPVQVAVAEIFNCSALR